MRRSVLFLLILSCSSPTPATPTTTITTITTTTIPAATIPVVAEEAELIQILRVWSPGQVTVVDSASDQELVKAGYSVCDQLDAGVPLEDVEVAFLSGGLIQPFSAVAIQTLCPQHLSSIIPGE